MRIIAGSARGRRILSVPKKLATVRPISGRIRQSVFDIIRPKMMGCHFLDLFAGTGAVGLEALSRGAEKVTFVELDKRCISVIEKNLERVGWKEKGKVFHGNVMGPLSWIPFRAGVEKYDLIFMGPPYKDEEKRPLSLSKTVLAHLAEAKLLADDGWCIVQHHFREDPTAPPGLGMFRQSKYGDTRVSFFRVLPPSAA